MSIGIKSFIPILSGLLWTLCFFTAQAQTKTDSKDSGSKKLFGNATILSNYVDKGITQSDKSWALQAGFGYQMGPQARFGLWGSSVKLPTNEENLNLRLYFDVKMDFTTNTALVLRYDFNRYFQGSSHNGNIISGDFTTFGYHILLDQDSNWEGTSTPSTSFGFSKEYNVPYNFVITPKVGYNQVSATGYTNYFDARVGAGYRFADVLYELAFHYNSNSSQFAGRGDMAFVFGILAKF